MNENRKYLAEFKETVLKYYPISDESFSLFENIIGFQTFEKDEILLNIDKVSKHIHFICKGAVIAYFTDDKGDIYTKNIFWKSSSQVPPFPHF